MKDLRPVEHYENRRFMKRIFFVIALCLMGVLSGYAQEVVTGTVVDSKNNPIPGARVELEGRSEYCMTDIDGTFRIESPVAVQKVKVSYVGLKTVTKKITPDMVVKLGRGWRDAPENYQWFAGANVGAVMIDNEFENNEMTKFAFGLKAGRVKKVGWYVGTFMNPEVFSGSDTKSFSAVVGGVFRLWCPLHIYVGGGYSYMRCPENEYSGAVANYNGGAFDLGFMFRVKNISIDWGVNTVIMNGMGLTAPQFGVSYFFGN